ncbi:DNA mismatch repair protein MutT [Bacillus thuringiensis serovar yunnanensis]|nr:DNA mismatch repair protein MutT [Bacillus thuringiensis serovar yunnanensis]
MSYVQELRKVVGHRPLILPGAVVVLTDEKKQILLQKRKEPEGLWGIPGGLMEPGESLENTVKRELFEETNLQVDKLSLVGVFSGNSFFRKLQNGDQFYSVTIVYTSKHFKGNLEISDDESMELRFFKYNEIPSNLIASHKEILNSLGICKKFNGFKSCI